MNVHCTLTVYTTKQWALMMIQNSNNLLETNLTIHRSSLYLIWGLVHDSIHLILAIVSRLTFNSYHEDKAFHLHVLLMMYDVSSQIWYDNDNLTFLFLCIAHDFTFIIFFGRDISKAFPRHLFYCCCRWLDVSSLIKEI